MANKLFIIAVLSAVVVLVDHVSGHGTVIDPVSRSTRWRYNSSAPHNWNDNELYCGGYGTQWDLNGGKCGFCGDDYRNPQPRANEHGGTFGNGVITGQYSRGGLLPVSVRITANHIGYFIFHICNMDQNGRESEECFGQRRLTLVNGTDRYNIPMGVLGIFDVTLRLPADLSCQHCVLQWIYVTGNRWGWCEDGSGGLGCGPQEQFRQCSDIRISSSRAPISIQDINSYPAPKNADLFENDVPPEFE